MWGEGSGSLNERRVYVCKKGIRSRRRFLDVGVDRMTNDTRILTKILLRGLKQIVSLLEKYLRGELKEDTIT